MVDSLKQAVTGFKISTFGVRKAKDGEKLKVVIQANVDELGAADYSWGDILAAILSHSTGDQEVGLSLFMPKKKAE